MNRGSAQPMAWPDTTTLDVAPITRGTLALFAGASGDHNPLHIDLDAARAAGYDDVFAQGMLSMAYLGRMLTSWVPQHCLRSFEVRFLAITPVHAALRCNARVSQIYEATDERLATVELTAELADGTITLTGTAVVAVDQLPCTDDGGHRWER